MCTATIQKARAVRLCTEVFSLLDALHGPWVTPSSYSHLFIFRCCWPLLKTLEEGSSDCCPCVNLSVPPHTHILFPPVRWCTTATFSQTTCSRQNTLINSLQKFWGCKKSCVKKQKHLELCLLKGCFIHIHPLPKGCCSLLTFGRSEPQLPGDSMLKYTYILKAQCHPCLSSVTW